MSPKNTYLGIGSAPSSREKILDEIKMDQIIPIFIIEELIKDSEKWRLIHFDPQFKDIEFMKFYFKKKGADLGLNFYYNELEHCHTWTSDNERIEVFIFDKHFFHGRYNYNNDGNDEWFLHLLNENILMTDKKLLVQEYTGHELSELSNRLCNISSNPQKFKKKILYDITNGEDCHCMTDLSLYRPFYDKDGNFINILLLKEEELLTILGSNPNIDTIVRKYFTKKLKEIVNINLVNYRRSLLKIGGNLFSSNHYDDYSSPSVIMEFMKTKVYEMLKVFKKFNFMTPNKEILINILFTRYSKIDPYKWQSHFNLFFNEEDVTDAQLNNIKFDYVVPK